MQPITRLPEIRRGLIHEVDGHQAWFVHAWIEEGRPILRCLLQRMPCSGKIPDGSDLFEIELPIASQAHTKLRWWESITEGNPGAMTVLEKLDGHLERRNFTIESAMLWLFANDITGPLLWKVYKDHNDKDIEQVANHILRGWSDSPLPFSPDNFLIDPDMSRAEVAQDPLNRHHQYA